MKTTVSGSSRIASWAAIVFAAAAAAPALAQDDDKGGSYEASVWVIRATKSNSDVSKELKPIVGDLKKQYKYTGYKLEKRKSGKVPVGKAFAYDAGDGYMVKVTPLDKKLLRVKFSVSISHKKDGKQRERANSTITIGIGKFQLFGGWKYDDKSDDIMIIAVSVR